MRIRTLFVTVSLGLSFGAGLFLWVTWHTFEPLRVVFFDVGQGDATLISQGGVQVLIDGGRDGKVLLGKLGRFMPFWDRQIEVVITTHPDADHIGGVADALRRYRVAAYFSNGAESTSSVFQDLKQALANTEATKQAVMGTGSRIIFPQGGELVVLFPESGTARVRGETNESSIVARLSYGTSSFLFTGDLPNEEVVLPDIVQTSVLKVAHHGSKYSTSEDWLDRVQPEEVIISVGKNRYGHPAQETLARLQRRLGVRTYRTDQLGDIVYVCHGNSCRQEK